MDETKHPTKIVTLREQRFRTPGFPGWGDPNYADCLVDLPAGQTGVVTGRESHGSSPWTRYSVRLDSGHRAGGRVDGTNFRVVET